MEVGFIPHGGVQYPGIFLAINEGRMVRPVMDLYSSIVENVTPFE